MLSRRGLITGLISLAAAPAIVRASSLMPVKVMEPTYLRVRLPPENRQVWYFQNRYVWISGPRMISFSEPMPEDPIWRAP